MDLMGGKRFANTSLVINVKLIRVLKLTAVASFEMFTFRV